MLKICYLPTLSAGCTKQRCTNPADAIFDFYKQQSVQVMVDVIVPYASNACWVSNCVGNQELMDRIEGCFRVFDIVIISWVQSPECWNYLLELSLRYKTKLGLDLDDAVGFDNEDNSAINARTTQYNYDLAAKEVTTADFVICSTAYLEQLVKPLNSNTYLMRNWIEWEQPKPELVVVDKPKVLYIAASGHTPEIEFVAKLSEGLTDRFDFMIRYSAAAVPACLQGRSDIDHRRICWPIQDYGRNYQSLAPDIVLAPIMHDTVFNRCKSELKVLEGMACNAVVVASALPTYLVTLGKAEASILYAKNSVKAWQEQIEAAGAVERNTRAVLDKYYNREQAAKQLVAFLKEQRQTVEALIKQKYTWS